MAGNTPIYGFPYPEPTDLVADYPALGQQLAEDIEDVLPAIGGLAPATPTSIANSGGTATLSGNTVTFSGVSSVSLNGCFTGDYNNYRVLVRATRSATSYNGFRLRVGGTDSSASYSGQLLGGYSTVSYSSPLSTSSYYDMGNSEADLTIYTLEVFGPALPGTTCFLHQAHRNTGNGTVDLVGGRHAVSTAYDGFTFLASSGTLTGSLSIYGYRK